MARFTDLPNEILQQILEEALVGKGNLAIFNSQKVNKALQMLKDESEITATSLHALNVGVIRSNLMSVVDASFKSIVRATQDVKQNVACLLSELELECSHERVAGHPEVISHSQYYTKLRAPQWHAEELLYKLYIANCLSVPDWEQRKRSVRILFWKEHRLALAEDQFKKFYNAIRIPIPRES